MTHLLQVFETQHCSMKNNNFLLFLACVLIVYEVYMVYTHIVYDPSKFLDFQII